MKPKVGILKRKAEENETGSETSETESEPEFVGEEVKKGENEGGILERSLGKRKHHSNALSSLALSYSRKERKKKKKLRWIDEVKWTHLASIILLSHCNNFCTFFYCPLRTRIQMILKHLVFELEGVKKRV